MEIALGTPGAGDEGLWTVDQAAEFLKLKPYTVRVWVRRGMPAIKIGGRLRFIPDELKRWLKRFRS
jgi:excisionase family DNA binding protein